MSPENSALPPQDGQAAAPTSPEPAAPVAPASAQTDKPAGNLHEDPNFRKLQSQYEKRMADMRRELDEIKGREEQAKLAEMDDVDRYKYEAEKYRTQLEQLTQTQQLEAQKRQVLTELSERSGVPVEELMEADSAYEAALLALDKTRRGQTQRIEANKVDLGGGRANTPADRSETAMRDAYRERDPVAYVRLLREAQT
jgi:hypothetical protein